MPGSQASAATLALNSIGKLGRLPDLIDAIVATIVSTKISVGTTVASWRYPVHTVLTELLLSNSAGYSLVGSIAASFCVGMMGSGRQ